MQHETSIQHRKNLETGLTVHWVRSTGSTDADWSVVRYNDGSRWLFTNDSAELVNFLGDVSDGLNTAEILETDNGAIIALYGAGPEMFQDRDEWFESLSESDKPEADKMLNR